MHNNIQKRTNVYIFNTTYLKKIEIKCWITYNDNVILSTDSTDLKMSVEEETMIIIKKQKKINNTPNTPHSPFINQVLRKDVLENMLSNTNLSGKDLFDLIMKENKAKSCCEM